LIDWAEGKSEQAINQARVVLERDPDNIHALASLVRFLLLSGDLDVAQGYAEQVKTSQANAWEAWTKKIEVLSYLADDAGILEIYEQVQAASLQDQPVTELFYHLVAVALARTGNLKKNQKLWEKALKYTQRWSNCFPDCWKGGDPKLRILSCNWRLSSKHPNY
jgi:tetratricopeptide (TPR) repeat protein